MTNIQIITSIPNDFQTDFLRETESDVLPAIRMENQSVIFPALIRADEREIEGESKTFYLYFEVAIPYCGQNTEDYDKCKMQCYGALRRYFYGPAEVQLEQQLKGTFAKHQYAVRQMFPKSAGEVIPGVQRFEEIKAEFWATIDEVLVSLGKTRKDLPAMPFTAETMLVWARANGMSDEDIAVNAQTISALSLNLLHNGRNWNELF